MMSNSLAVVFVETVFLFRLINFKIGVMLRNTALDYHTRYWDPQHYKKKKENDIINYRLIVLMYELSNIE